MKCLPAILFLILTGCSLSKKPESFFINGQKIDFYGLDKNDFKDERAFKYAQEGKLCFINNEPQKAKTKLIDALNIEPNNIYVVQTLAIIETHSGEPRNALSRLKKALAIDPTFTDFYLNISMCYLSLQEYYSANLI